MSEVTKVDCLTTFAEKQQAIEDLEQLARRLMDPIDNRKIEFRTDTRSYSRAENSLSVIRQTTQELHDGPRGLTVQTARRLVEEQK